MEPTQTDPREAIAEKLPYQKPEVVEFGRVEDLTRGGGSRGTEPGPRIRPRL